LERKNSQGNSEKVVTEKVIIIGSGPAGWASAIYSARANLNPVLFEGAITDDNRLKGTLPLGQLNLTTEVENYPGFPAGNLRSYLDNSIAKDKRQWMTEHSEEGVSGPELMELMRQQATNFGTKIITDDVIDIDMSSHPFKVKTLSGTEYETLAVIVATGARANYLGLESEEKFKNMGVSACAVCDGALPRYRNQPMVVVGGGDSAMEEATFLTKFGSKVYIIHRRDSFRASKIMAERALANEKIDVKWNSVVGEVLGNETEGVTGVRIHNIDDESDSEELPCTGYFAAIGHTPNTDFLHGKLETTDKGYIIWTKSHRTYTSVDGIFAAGDVADDQYRQAITAAGSGCMAALDAERWLVEKGYD